MKKLRKDQPANCSECRFREFPNRCSKKKRTVDQYDWCHKGKKKKELMK